MIAPANKLPGTLLLIVLSVLVLSALRPYDRVTWWMEVAPVIIAIPVLAVSYRTFPLSPLLYIVIALHACILICGGYYTYARVPLGFWMEEWFSFTRNNYDKIGHFFQGFTPALVTRELFIRRNYLRRGPMLAFICLCVPMAISAWYELIEWGAAVALGQGADEFLGTQGDIWDTQEDMFSCFIGALSALAAFSWVQEKFLGNYRQGRS
jgi:putative membrane protein